MVHVSAGSTYDVYTTDWVILNCFASCLSWEIPIFVMISGRFFLAPQKTITPQIMIRKYIKRLMIAFITWSAALQVYYILCGSNTLNWKGIFIEFVIGRYPYWYLWMLMGLYLITPFLRMIATDKKTMEMYIILSFIFNAIVKIGPYIPGFGSAITAVLSESEFHFVLGFSGYFLLGYYLHEYPLPDRIERSLYILLPALLVFACVGTTLQSRAIGENEDFFSTYLMPNVTLEAVAIYTFFTKRVAKIDFTSRMRNFFSKGAEYSFGIYLVHPIVNNIVGSVGLTSTFTTPFVAVPVATIVVCLICILIVYVIRKIPCIGKMIT